MRNLLFASAAAIGIALAGAAAAQDKTEPWLPTLQTKTPEEGFALAIELSRKAVTTTQTEKTVLFTLRENYAHDPNSLIAARMWSPSTSKPSRRRTITGDRARK